MKKLATPLQAIRLVKSSDKLWYIDFYDDAGKRQRLKQGMNRIHDLKARELYAEKIIRQLNGQPIELPSTLPPSVIQVNFKAHLSEFITLREKVLAYGTVKVFRTCRNVLELFSKAVLKKPFPDFSDFDLKFPLRFQGWCFEKPRQYSVNYVSKMLAVIRQFLSDAQDNGLDVPPSYKTKKYSLRKTDVDDIALTFKDVEALTKLHVTGALAAARDVFVFTCLTGLRHSDVSRVTKAHISDLMERKAVTIITQKTGEKVKVPLHDLASAVLERNGGSLPPPMINQVLNRHIKELGKKAGFTEGVMLRASVGGKTVIQLFQRWECLSAHSGRRTFATVAYSEWKMPAGLLMKLLGHRTERQFFQYIKLTKEAAALEMLEYL